MLIPVQRRSLSDAVFEQLRDQIVGGKWAAGAPLPPERTLAEMLGVNRGAVREALKRLAQARLVNIQHGGSTRVEDFQATAGLDLLTELLFVGEGQIRTEVARSVIEMRSALAPDVARLAALRASEAQKAELMALVESMEAHPEDLLELQRLANRFWIVAVEGSGNVAYRLALNTMNRTYDQLFSLLTEVLRDELTDLAGYRTIARAIQRGDTARAERRAAELTRKGAERILALVDALDLQGKEP